MSRHWRDVICGGDEDRWHWVQGWFAHMFQNPGTQGDVAVAIRGPRGSGKSLPVREIGKILGQHFIHIADPRHRTGNFNAHLQDAVMVFADEAVGSRSRESTLKMLITEPAIPIERKGLDVTFAKNCCHLILASNEDWIVPAGMDERRYLGVISNEVVHSGFLGKNGRYHTFRSVREETPSEASS